VTNRTDGQAVLNLVAQLVHEASHQAFYLLRTLGPVVNPDHAGLMLHSAVKGRRRPLEFVLMAYHAFVNILIALRSLPPSELIEPPSRREAEADVVGKVRSMADELASVPGLTPTGTELLHLLQEASAGLLTTPSRGR
jgi:HEXXH motif-containing protein